MFVPMLRTGKRPNAKACGGLAFDLNARLADKMLGEFHAFS